MASFLFCESFLPDIPPVIFSLKVYHLRDEVRALQSLCQRGSQRGDIEDASARRVNSATFRSRAGVIHLHALNALCFFEAEDLLSIFDFARITICDQYDRCSSI